MDGHEITFALEGERIPLRDFAAAVQDLYSLIAGLSDDLAREADIRWLVQDLQVGSAVAVFHGQSANPDGVARVVAAYHVVGHALRTQEPIPYSERVRNAAHSLVKLLGADVTGVRFGTIDDGIHISALPPFAVAEQRAAVGAVEGRVQTLRELRRLHFTLYDAIHQRGVDCVMAVERKDQMRAIWGHQVRVEGVVHRNVLTGHPVRIDPVSDVRILDGEQYGDYRRARGVAPVPEGSIDSMEAVRRVRNA